MSNYAVGLVIVLYLSMLFVIAYVAEKNKRSKVKRGLHQAKDEEYISFLST